MLRDGLQEEVMNDILTTVFGLCGGLAMFLFGMNSMSDALQKAAGARMKQILSYLTRNPIMGALIHNTGSVLVIINAFLLLHYKN